MLHQNPGLCNDPGLSSTACPRFCKKCPLVCHHCDATVQNFTDCNTTRTCQIGEQCMLHQLTSSGDGHHEYRMSCASVEMCDGTGLMPFGRRGLQSRDINVHCCTDDMCNHPACKRDIEILIQDSTDSSASQHIIQFLKDLVSHLDIGPTDNLVGLASIEVLVNRQFHLNSHTTKSDLLQALDRIKFNHRTNLVDVNDVTHFLNNELHQGSHNGDRPAYANAVLIIANHATKNTHSHLHHDDQNAILSSMTVINVGSGSNAQLDSLATDPQHVLSVTDYPSLSQSLSHVLALFCM
ncbi:collagen alpha-3(VI) chain-like isoform X2 [Mercenaria mercenaria]|nr:collagen alpha-3(VI) chain-like isoform X2 [Mercenaria mercenaria]